MLRGSFDYRLVALSVLIAMGAAYVALDLAGRVTAAVGRVRRYWLAGGAISMGVGIWSMHYIGMLAFTLPVPVLYDVPTVLVSLLAAIVASGIALFVVSRSRLNAINLTVGSIVMGAAVATMHYVGMDAMRLPAMCGWNTPIVALSVVIAVVVSLVALWLTFRLRSETRAFTTSKTLSAGLMGVAVAAMHYTGMAAVTYMPTPDVMGSTTTAVSISSLGLFGITLVAFMVLGLAIVTSVVDQRLTAKDLELQSSEQRYRLLFDRSLAGVYQSDFAGRLINCNEAMARILGFPSRLDCLDHQVLDLYQNSQDRATFLREIGRKGRVEGFEMQLRRRDGTPVWVFDSATLVEGSSGQSSLIEGTVIDISRRKEIEDQLAARGLELKASMERYKQLVESTDAVPWEMDGRKLVFTYMSPQALRIFGHDADAIVQEPSVWNLVPAADRDRLLGQFRALAASAEGSIDTEHRILAASGHFIDVRSIVSVYRVDGEVVLRGITLDVTNQRKLQLELQQAQKVEAVGRLAAGIAHEINTPVQFVSDSLHFVREATQDLTALFGRCRSLTAGPETDVAARDALIAAEQSADVDYLLANVPKAIERSLEGLGRVATIVRSLKEFAHPDQREMASVDLNQAIESTLVVARNEYKYVADVVLDLGAIPRVTCYGGDVNQAILNIVVNAAHAIGSRVDGSGDRGRITVRTSQSGDHVVIAISDTGGGIPEAIRDRIFDPFFTTKDVGKGTGQGLAIARSVIVDRHGGDLRFETEIGVGTTFLIRLPIHGARRAGAAA